MLTKLSRQLYPSGRAWKMPYQGIFEGVHTALAVSEDRAWRDALATLDSALPDNTNFTAEDAADWERRLGLITNTDGALENRIAAIRRKINHPGTMPARQNYRYLEDQLRVAGFAGIRVYENRFPDGSGGYTTRSPAELSPGSATVFPQHGQIVHGPNNHGPVFANIVANHIDEEQDRLYGLGPDLKNTFFVGGNPIGSLSNILMDRKAEFREMILKIKPVQTVAFLFVRYL